MTKPSTHGHTKSGREITDEVVEQLAAEAETGYDVDTLIARRGNAADSPSGHRQRA